MVSGRVRDNPHISISESVKKGHLLHFGHKCKRSHFALILGAEGSSIRGHARFLHVYILHIFLHQIHTWAFRRAF